MPRPYVGWSRQYVNGYGMRYAVSVSGDAGLPAAVAAVLEISPQEAEERLRAAT